MLQRIARSVLRNGIFPTLAKGYRRGRGNIARLYLMSRRVDPVPSYYGVKLAPNWGDATFEACTMGLYGTFLSDYLKGFEEKFAFVDIGANQGLYSFVAAKNPACECAIALEPVSATYALLTKNVELNSMQHKVIALQYGISTEEASLPIYKVEGHSGAASLQTHTSPDAVVAETVTIRRAEALTPHLPSGRPIVIKIDVEGHELHVIRSLMEATYRDRIAAVFCEVDERWVDAGEMNVELERLGLTNLKRVGSGFHYDLLATRNAS